MFSTRTLKFERQPVKKHIIAMIAVVAILYLPALALPEYRASDEAIYSQLARDIVENGNWLTPQLHGLKFSTFPMYSWMVAICSGFAVPTPFSVRLPSVIALGLLALVCALIARKEKGNLAAMVAAAVILSSYAGLHVGMLGQGDIVAALWLTSAWFSLYYLGNHSGCWNYAWSCSFLFVFLAVLTIGFSAIWIFYLPLFFLRNANGGFAYLRTTQHICWLAFFCAIVLIWFKLINPEQPFFFWNDEIQMGNPVVSDGYWHHLLCFPFKTIIYLLPWGVLFWVPFCLAFRQFEPNNDFCGYLRTIVFSHFFVCWILPNHTPLMLLFVAGAMAVLLGIGFEVPANRYRKFFSRVTHLIGWLEMVGYCAACVFWTLVSSGKIQIVSPAYFPSFNLSLYAMGLACVCFACMILVWTQIVYRSSEGRVAMTLFWSACGMRFLWICVVLPVLYLTVDGRRQVGLQLLQPLEECTAENAFVMQSMPSDAVIYYRLGVVNIVSLAYLNHSLVAIESPVDDLPSDDDVVYLLSHEKPAVPQRIWTPISESVPVKVERMFDLNAFREARIGRYDDIAENCPKVRIYRGKLRD